MNASLPASFKRLAWANLGAQSAEQLSLAATAIIGAALGGAIGATFGEPACLVVALAGFVAQAGLIAASQIRGLESLPAPAYSTPS